MALGVPVIRQHPRQAGRHRFQLHPAAPATTVQPPQIDGQCEQFEGPEGDQPPVVTHHSAIVSPTAPKRGTSHSVTAVNTAGPTVTTTSAPISNGTKVSSSNALDALVGPSLASPSRCPITPRSTGPVRCASSLLTCLVVVMAWTFLPPEELTHRRPTGERQEGPVSPSGQWRHAHRTSRPSPATQLERRCKGLPGHVPAGRPGPR